MGYMSDQEQRQILSDNLTHLIHLSGKGQKQIAMELDLNPPTFNQWVNGKAMPSLTALKKMADYFGIGLLELVEENKCASSVKNFNDKLCISYHNAKPHVKAAINVLLGLEEERK